MGGHHYHPILENRDFSGTEPLLDLRPVCKLEFVRFGAEQKNPRTLFLSRFSCGELILNSEIDIFKKFSGDEL